MPPLHIFRMVLLALFLREFITRFGKGWTGPVWLIVEPMLHILVLLFIFSAIDHRMMLQIPFPLFLATGIVPFFMLRNIITAVMSSIDSNKALFAYRPVKPIDTYIARTFLEVLIYGSVFIVILGGMYLIGGYEFSIPNPLMLLLSFFILIVLGFGMGIGFSIMHYSFPKARSVVMVLMTFLYFTSAVMYPLWILPSDIQELLGYNPFLHLIELIRESIFTYYPPVENISILFPAVVAIFILFGTLSLYHRKKLKLAASS